MEVILLWRKDWYDVEEEVIGVFSNKKKIQEYKKWLRENYPPLYESATWREEKMIVDMFYSQ